MLHVVLGLYSARGSWPNSSAAASLPGPSSAHTHSPRSAAASLPGPSSAHTHSPPLLPSPATSVPSALLSTATPPPVTSGPVQTHDSSLTARKSHDSHMVWFPDLPPPPTAPQNFPTASHGHSSLAQTSSSLDRLSGRPNTARQSSTSGQPHNVALHAGKESSRTECGHKGTGSWNETQKHKGSGSGNETETKERGLSQEDRIALYLSGEGGGGEKGGTVVGDKRAGPGTSEEGTSTPATKTKPKKRRRI